MYSYQDVDLTDYGDEDTIGQNVVSLTNKGLLLERMIFYGCREAGLVPMGFTPTSSVTGVDLKLFIKDYTYSPRLLPDRGRVVGIELKEKPGDDYGQSQMEWDKSSGWFFRGKDDAYSAEKRTMLKKANADAKINQMWKNKPAPKLFDYLRRGMKSTQVSSQDRDFDKENFQEEKYDNDGLISIVENYYSSKGCPYINLASHGLYYFKDDPLGLKMEFGIPSFRNSIQGMYLRFRYKPSGVSSYGFNAAMKIKGNVTQSPVNLIDDSFIKDLQDDAILCENAPYPLKELRKKLNK